MKTDQMIRSLAMRHWTNTESVKREQNLFHFKRRILGQQHQVKYFHQVDDPYSLLAAQLLPKLTAAYKIDLEVVIVPSPDKVDAPEQALLRQYANQDCQRIAPYYGLDYTPFYREPCKDLINLAQTILLQVQSPELMPGYIKTVSNALVQNHRGTLEQLAKSLSIDLDASRQVETQKQLKQNHQLRKGLGHYSGAMFFYGSQWYWGVDRFCYLEKDLIKQDLNRENHLIVNRPTFKHLQNNKPNDVTLEYYFSLRSPYTYVSMQRVFELADNLNIKLALRPVLPMMMRGVPATMAKGKYIFSDAKREADEVFNVSFGDICDPFGKPVERGYALFYWALSQKKGRRFALNFCRAAFSKKADLNKDSALRLVVENSGLDWTTAQTHLKHREWQDLLEQNRLTLYKEMGLWGVPSFRLTLPGQDPINLWGADRLWLIEDQVHRHFITTQENEAIVEF